MHLLRKLKFFAVSAGLGLTATAEQAKAAEPYNDGPIVVAQLDTITVSATRNPMAAFDYPGQVSVIDREIIEDISPSSLSDVFQAIPGAEFSGGPRRSGEVPTIRGLSGQGVLVLFDGARQSFLSGHDGRFFVDPEIVQAVEVIRGPASALYGSGALGGVISVRTMTARDFLRPDEQAGAKLTGGFQSVNNEWRGTATGAWRSENGKLDVIGSATYRTSGDIALGSGLDLPADDEIVSSLLKSTFRPTDELSISLSWLRYGSDSLDPNNPQGATLPEPGNENVRRDIADNTVQASLLYSPQDNRWIDFNLTGYWTKSTVDEEETTSPRVISRQVESLGLSFDNRSRFKLGEQAMLTFTYGGEVYEDKQIGRDNATSDGSRGGVPDASTTFFGAFLQAELNWAEPVGLPGSVDIIPAIRWDRFESRAVGEQDLNEDALSPKIGIAYHPVPEFMLFGNWAEAFRAPSINEIYADGIHFQIPDLGAMPAFPPTFVTNFFISNPDLKSEQSKSWELGVGIDLRDVLTGEDHLIAKVSYYRSDVTDLIDLEVSIPAGCFGAPFPPCGSGLPFGNYSRNVNVTDARIEGVELQLNYHSPRWYVRANYSTIDGKNADTGEFVGLLTPDRFYIDAGINWYEHDIRIGGRLTVAGSFEAVNDPVERRDSYIIGDVYLVWEPRTGPLEGLRLDLGIDNIGDTDYDVVAAGATQPGRNFKITLGWREGF